MSASVQISNELIHAVAVRDPECIVIEAGRVIGENNRAKLGAANGHNPELWLEAILIQVLEPRLNRRGPNWTKMEEYLQFPPEFRERRRRRSGAQEA
jgi:hypothetical protein